MDLTELLIALIIILVIALLSAIIYRFGTSGKTYDEILEEQRREQSAFLEKPKVVEGKKDKDKKKRTFKKHKTGEKAGSQSEDELNGKISSDVDSGVDLGGAVDRKEVVKTAKSVKKTNAVKSEKVEQVKRKEVPSEKKDAKRASESPLSSSSVSGNGKPSVGKQTGVTKIHKTDSSSVLQETEVKSVQTTSLSVTSTAAAAKKSEVKIKKKGNDVDVIALPVEEKIFSITAPLPNLSSPATVTTRTTKTVEQPKSDQQGKKKDGSDKVKEVKTRLELVESSSATTSIDRSDKLSSKILAQPADEWLTHNAKPDLNVTLKKQIEDKDLEMRNLQAQLQSANAKFGEIRQELATVRQKYTTLERSAQTEITAKTQENEALKSRMHHTHEQHTVELSKLSTQLQLGGVNNKGQIAAEGAGNQVQVIMQLTEENRLLKEAATKLHQGQPNADQQQHIKFMDEALKQNSKLLNASDNAKRTLETKLKQTEDQQKKLEIKLRDTEAIYSRKVREVSEELVKAQSHSNSSSQNSELAVCQTKLQEKERRTSELETKTAQLESKFVQLDQLLHERDSEIQSLRSQLEQSSGKGQINRISENGVSDESVKQNQILIETLSRYENSQTEICRLQTSLLEKSASVEHMLQELEHAKQINFDIDLQLQSCSDISRERENLKVEINRLQTADAVKSHELANVTEELHFIKSSRDNDHTQSALNQTISDLSTELEKLDRERTTELLAVRAELDALRQANDDLNTQLHDYSKSSNELEKYSEEINRLTNLNEESLTQIQKLTEDLKTANTSSSHHGDEAANRQLLEVSEELHRCKEDLVQLKAVLSEKSENLQRLIVERESLQNSDSGLQSINSLPVNSDLHNELQRCKDEISRLEKQLSETRHSDETKLSGGDVKAQEEVDSSNKQLADLLAESDKFKQDVFRLETVVIETTQHLQHANEEIERLRHTSVPSTITESVQFQELSDQVIRYKEELDRLQSVSTEKSSDFDSVVQELNDVKKSKDELTEQSLRHSENVVEIEKHKEEVVTLKTALETKSRELERVQNEYTRIVNESHTLAINGDNADHHREEALRDAKESEKKLQADVLRYKGVLVDTEAILHKLQSSVEQEEQVWQQKLHAAENQLEKYSETIRDLEKRLHDEQIEKQSLQGHSRQDISNGLTPSIDHKEEKLIKSVARKVTYPAPQELN